MMLKRGKFHFGCHFINKTIAILLSERSLTPSRISVTVQCMFVFKRVRGGDRKEGEGRERLMCKIHKCLQSYICQITRHA